MPPSSRVTLRWKTAVAALPFYTATTLLSAITSRGKTTPTSRAPVAGGASSRTQAPAHTKWIDNIAVTDLGIHKYNTAIATVSLKGIKNTDVTWQDNVTLNGTPGAELIRTSSGNASPSAKSNDLGKNPGLTASEIKAIANAMSPSASGSSSKSSAAEDQTGTGTPQRPRPTPAPPTSPADQAVTSSTAAPAPTRSTATAAMTSSTASGQRQALRRRRR